MRLNYTLSSKKELPFLGIFLFQPHIILLNKVAALSATHNPYQLQFFQKHFQPPKPTPISETKMTEWFYICIV